MRAAQGRSRQRCAPQARARERGGDARAIDLHRIRPVVDKVFPFTEVREAFRAMQAGEHFGKIVLTFGD